MGRDVTGFCASPVKAKFNGASNETVVKDDAHEFDHNGSSNAKLDVLEVKSPNLEDAEPCKVEETKPSSLDKSALGMAAVKHVQTKHIVQTEEHHVCASPITAESPVVNSVYSPGSSKKSQSNTPFTSKKRSDDEDNWSMTSSNASAKTARSRTTVPVAPRFGITDRLEKRKEFYSKLEEKHKALEEEKREYEERNKEEQQAAIRQLRKAMTYRANPVPSFYHEGPPPKKELKKLPTTRAVSPKLGCSRRKSYGDAVSCSSEEKVACARVARLSLGNSNTNCKHGYLSPTGNPKKKGPVCQQSGSKISLKKGHPKQQPKVSSDQAPSPKGPKPAPLPSEEQEPAPATQDLAQQTNGHISVES